ncbi:MAG: biotin/lipoyl-binding protein, partial [Acidimicrobiales bacterium]|nr:biotin/lipoyl-binding protein [Acidimicrobiales bacterium]
GTVEFMVADDGTINFLEVNTRLQVEHPVTEAVTGLDLVELQLMVASGQPLPMSQDDIGFEGHAIEVRVVAEDPTQGWLPSTGLISHFDIGDGVRVDTGVRAGAEISPDYDSLIAKVIAHGPTRRAAARRMQRALRASLVAGVSTDIQALVAIMDEPDYLAAATPTAYLDEHPAVVAGSDGSHPDQVALLVAATLAADRASRAADRATPFAPSGWRNLAAHGQRVVWDVGSVARPVEYRLCPANPVSGSPESAEFVLGAWPEPGPDGTLPEDTRQRISVRRLASNEGREVVEVEGRRWAVDVEVSGRRVVARSPMAAAVFDRAPRFVDHDTQEGGSGPICPLPGTVIAVHVQVGERVQDGQLLMVVEAMKMEHKITATGSALVTEVRFAQGDRVDAGDLLVALDHETPT